MTSTALATRQASTLATAAAPAPSYGFKMLDVYAGGLVSEPGRLEAIATISAGRKVTKSNRDGKSYTAPERSSDGVIVLHDPDGRAPGLKEALEATGYKQITVAFPWDNPDLFVQQRFTRYSATALQVYGDGESITEIRGKERFTFQAGTREYIDLVSTCKVSVSVYFALASMEGGVPSVYFPDGLAYYRMRFTSRNSLRSLESQIVTVQRATGGRIAGIPFDVTLVNREVSDPDGNRRTVPVWTFLPFKGARVTSDTFRGLTQRALDAGSALMLPAPEAETLDVAVRDVPIDDDAMEQALSGGTCDSAHYRAAYFAAVDGTDYDTEEARGHMVSTWTNGRTNSLAAFLETATETEASAFIEWVREAVAQLQAEKQASQPKAAQAARGFDPASVEPWVKRQIALPMDLSGDQKIDKRDADLLHGRFALAAGDAIDGMKLRAYLTGKNLGSFAQLTRHEAAPLLKLANHPQWKERLAATWAYAQAQMPAQVEPVKAEPAPAAVAPQPEPAKQARLGDNIPEVARVRAKQAEAAAAALGMKPLPERSPEDWQAAIYELALQIGEADTAKMETVNATLAKDLEQDFGFAALSHGAALEVASYLLSHFNVSWTGMYQCQAEALSSIRGYAGWDKLVEALTQPAAAWVAAQLQADMVPGAAIPVGGAA